jgi:hypothetical protein
MNIYQPSITYIYIYIYRVSQNLCHKFFLDIPHPQLSKNSYQHGSKSGQVPRYPLLCRNPRNAVIHKKHATMSNARQYENDHFPGKLIGRNGPVAWPPRSQSYRFLPLGPTLKMKFTPHPLPTLTSYGNAS